jgi:hypothetical protein
MSACDEIAQVMEFVKTNYRSERKAQYFEPTNVRQSPTADPTINGKIGHA